MVIQHNMPAKRSYRSYRSNSSAVAKNLQKLSSGYKINNAADDAAGLAISEKMRAHRTFLSSSRRVGNSSTLRPFLLLLMRVRM